MSFNSTHAHTERPQFSGRQSAIFSTVNLFLLLPSIPLVFLFLLFYFLWLSLRFCFSLIDSLSKILFFSFILWIPIWIWRQKERELLKWVWAMAAPAPKPEEISHPAMDQLQGLEYCIDSNPSWGMAKDHSFSRPYFFNHWFINLFRSSGIFFCVPCLWPILISACENRGGNSFGFPALHFGLRNCCYDPIIPCSAHGWHWCELISFIYIGLHVI